MYVGYNKVKDLWLGNSRVLSLDKGYKRIYEADNFNYGSMTFYGKTYRTIIIGDQEWMVDNLANRLESYGIISYNTIGQGKLYDSYSFYYKNPNTEEVFPERGLMYSGCALDVIDSLTSDGWRVASAYDLRRLLDFVSSGDKALDSKNLRAKSYNDGNDKYGFGAKRTDYRGANDYVENDRFSIFSTSLVDSNLSMRTFIIDNNSARVSNGDSLYGGRFVRLVRYVEPQEQIHVWDGTIDSSLDMSGENIYIDTPEKFVYLIGKTIADKNIYITKDLYFNDPDKMKSVCKGLSSLDGTEKKFKGSISFVGNFLLEGNGHKIFGVINSSDSLLQFIPENSSSKVDATFNNISFECMYNETERVNSQLFRLNTYDRSNANNNFVINEIVFKDCYFNVGSGNDTYVPFFFRRWPNSGSHFYVRNILFENNIINATADASLFITQTRSGYTPYPDYLNIRYVCNSSTSNNVYLGEGNRSSDSGTLSSFRDISKFKKDNVGFKG